MNDQFKFDVRIRERLLAQRQISEAEVEKHLSALPDVEARSEPLGMAQPALGLDEDFDDEDDDDEDAS